jgi:hypothetical protein
MWTMTFRRFVTKGPRNQNIVLLDERLLAIPDAGIVLRIRIADERSMSRAPRRHDCTDCWARVAIWLFGGSV